MEIKVYAFLVVIHARYEDIVVDIFLKVYRSFMYNIGQTSDGLESSDQFAASQKTTQFLIFT